MTELAVEVASLREQVRSSHGRISALEESVKVMPRIETLLEIAIDTNKKQSDTLNNINANLTKLNNNYDNLTLRIGTIEDDFKTSRSHSSININKLITDTITKIIPSIMGGIILTWLVIQFGLK